MAGTRTRSGSAVSISIIWLPRASLLFRFPTPPTHIHHGFPGGCRSYGGSWAQSRSFQSPFVTQPTNLHARMVATSHVCFQKRTSHSPTDAPNVWKHVLGTNLIFPRPDWKIAPPCRILLRCQTRITSGANWVRPDRLRRRWRAVVGQQATLKADHYLSCQQQLRFGRLIKRATPTAGFIRRGPKVGCQIRIAAGHRLVSPRLNKVPG